MLTAPRPHAIIIWPILGKAVMSQDSPTHSVRTRELLVNASSPREAAELVICCGGDLDFSMISRSDITEGEYDQRAEDVLAVQTLDDTPNPGTYQVCAVRVAELNDQGNEINAWVDVEQVGPRLPLAIHVDLASEAPRYMAAVAAQRLNDTLVVEPASSPRPARF